MDSLVILKNEKPVTSSLQVAEIFNKTHKHVLESLDNLKKGVAENWADLFWEDTYVHPQNKQPYRMVYMTKDGFTLLAMGFTGKKAMQFKLKYIAAFNQMEEQLQSKYQVPTSFSAALRLAANQQAKIEEMKPKVRFADAVSSSDTSILIGVLAKILRQKDVNIGQNRLFEWMRGNGYLINRKGASFNTPTQLSMDLGLFDIKETIILHNDGHTTINKTTKVTGKGQQYFVNKFLKEGDI